MVMGQMEYTHTRSTTSLLSTVVNILHFKVSLKDSHVTAGAEVQREPMGRCYKGRDGV